LAKLAQKRASSAFKRKTDKKKSPLTDIEVGIAEREGSNFQIENLKESDIDESENDLSTNFQRGNTNYQVEQLLETMTG
jgi:hypothetical protein